MKLNPTKYAFGVSSGRENGLKTGFPPENVPKLPLLRWSNGLDPYPRILTRIIWELKMTTNLQGCHHPWKVLMSV